MKKIYINNRVPNFYLLFVIICFAVVPFLLLFIISGTIEGLAMFIIGTVLLIVWGVIVDCSRTKVEYDEKNIIYKRFWIESKIEIDKVKKVNWSVYSENYGRGGMQQRIEIIFGLDNNENDDFDEIVLNDRLTAEQVGEIIDGNSEDTPIMGLYRFIEKNYPEKAMGKVKHDDDF